MQGESALICQTATIQRAIFFHSVLKTTIEAFLGIFDSEGKHRKAFVQNVFQWVTEMMSKKDLWRQVQERSEANTTHLTNGSEAVRTIMDGYRSGNLEEDEYERILFTLHRAFFAEANEGSKFFFFFFFGRK
jgi:uncharacterized membrane protein